MLLTIKDGLQNAPLQTLNNKISYSGEGAQPPPQTPPLSVGNCVIIFKPWLRRCAYVCRHYVSVLLVYA